jgi:ABC-type multidrug transport system fused ATPase/permease subunit
MLFGKQMDKDFYEKVVDGCALLQDINIGSDGDLTMVEERGINLSKGQKQRIQLARAVYNDSDIYFLDDPFSAVDAHTGSHLLKVSSANEYFYSFTFMHILITLSFHSKNLPRSENVVQECLMKLLYDKTVVYATHQLEFLEAADLSLVSYIEHLCVTDEITAPI